MKKIVYFCLLVLAWTIVLFPQDVIWNNIKQNMLKNDIQIDAKDTKIQLYLLYNKVDITSLTLFNTVHVGKLKMRYSFINPTKIKLFGELENKYFEGEIDLYNKNISILLEEGKFKNTLIRSYFKKSSEGLKYEFAY